MTREHARAFWIREPGHGEIREQVLPPARPRPGAGRDTVLGDQSRHRGAGLQRQRARVRVPAHARAVPGRRFSRPREIRLFQRRPGGRGPAGVGRTVTCSACTRTRTATGCRRTGSRCCPRTCRRHARCWPPTWKPPSTPCGTLGSRAGDRISVVGAGTLGCLLARLAVAIPWRPRGTGGREPGSRRRGRRPRRGLLDAGRRTRGPRPGLPHQRQRRGPGHGASPGRLRGAGCWR